MSPEIDEFGEKIVRFVRDPAISAAEVLKNRGSKGPTRLKLNEYDPKIVEAVLDIVVPELVDDTIFHLMRAIDFGDIRLSYRSDADKECDLEDVGMQELHGWLFGDEGWVSRYSGFPTSQS